MEQSVISTRTVEIIINRAEGIIERDLTDMERTLIEYALDQVRLGLVEVK